MRRFYKILAWSAGAISLFLAAPSTYLPWFFTDDSEVMCAPRADSLRTSITCTSNAGDQEGTLTLTVSVPHMSDSTAAFIGPDTLLVEAHADSGIQWTMVIRGRPIDNTPIRHFYWMAGLPLTVHLGGSALAASVLRYKFDRKVGASRGSDYSQRMKRLAGLALAGLILTLIPVLWESEKSEPSIPEAEVKQPPTLKAAILDVIMAGLIDGIAGRNPTETERMQELFSQTGVLNESEKKELSAADHLLYLRAGAKFGKNLAWLRYQLMLWAKPLKGK